jgi:hypothetical protein
MNLLNLPPKWLLFLTLLSAMFSCTYTKTFPPKLNSKADTIITKIKNANGFEDITMIEKTTSGSQGDATVLTVRLFNDKNLPAEADTTALKKLGKDIASEIKPAFTDADTINSYVILFCTRVVDGSVTNTKYTGYEYKPGEL